METGAERPERAVLHVDMDSFYASVEVLLDPTLRGKPVIVGGAGARGVVASCSYEARSYGIHSAMPSVEARRRCPEAIFLHGRFDLYANYSRRIHGVFASFTPLVEGISLDEAFLDVTGAVRLFGPAGEIAHAVRNRVTAETGLACAVGVAPNKLLAKLASKAAKPVPTPTGPRPGLGVVEVVAGDELAFLHPLPVDALWGVGPATRGRLARFGVESIGDLARVPVASLVAALGKAHGRHLHDLAWGRDDRPVVPDQGAKSISHEETYPHDIDDPRRLATEAVRLADGVGSRLRHSGLAGRTVVVKIRFGDFRTITRSRTLPVPTSTSKAIADAAKALLARVDVSPGVRLLGVGMANLIAGGGQLMLELDTDDAGDGSDPHLPDSRWDDATRAVDAVRDRFGAAILGPASLVGDRSLRVKRPGDTQWGPGADSPDAAHD